MIRNPRKKPARRFLPYGRQSVNEEDISAVVEALRSDFLTTGPRVERFENEVAGYTGTRHAVAVSSGTAALHCAMAAAGIGPGDEVILPPMTFAATANAVVYQNGVPVFADVDPETLLIDPEDVENKITPRTKAVIAVDYAGQPCAYDRLRSIAKRHHLVLIADACHAIGATYKGKPGATFADMTIFSFHPVKHITTGEGGMIVTNDPALAERMRRFRNHGINADHAQRAQTGTWYYEITDMGFNYRITDIQCALGSSQLKRLPTFIEQRRNLAGAYDRAFTGHAFIQPLHKNPDTGHVYHLYVVKADFDGMGIGRKAFFADLRTAGIGANVHYIPVHLHPFYRERFGTQEGLCPVAENAYHNILSLPIHPEMDISDVDYTVEHMNRLAGRATAFYRTAHGKSQNRMICQPTGEHHV